MGAWEQYGARMSVRGNTRRQSHLNRELYSIEKHLPDSLYGGGCLPGGA